MYLNDIGVYCATLHTDYWRTEMTWEVGTKDPNRWCLYDVHGNVTEWCADTAYEYQRDPVVDPWERGLSTSDYRVYRGGSYIGLPIELRSAERGWVTANFHDRTGGFRLARTE